MKAYVLLNKKTGDLLEGMPISFLDESFPVKGGGDTFHISIMEQQGWAIYHPNMFGVPIFFNQQCEAWFENLGEL